MMTEKYPTWLTGHVKEWAEKRLPTVTLCSTTGNELLEVWYYGDLLTVKGEPQSYIVDGSPAPGLVAARDPESGEEFVIFDGGRHGYDNMFCDEHNPSELEHRPLKRYEIPASKLVLELGYSIDYKDEKEDFEPDEADTVELINGERMPWEQVKRDGIDYIALYYVNKEGKRSRFLDRGAGMNMVFNPLTIYTTTEFCATALTLKPIPCTWIPRPGLERKYPFTLPTCWAVPFLTAFPPVAASRNCGSAWTGNTSGYLSSTLPLDYADLYWLRRWNCNVHNCL